MWPRALPGSIPISRTAAVSVLLWLMRSRHGGAVTSTCCRGRLPCGSLSEGNRARGVEVLRRGGRETIWAEREIILCGGTVNSPQLLMLSGIGPADHLRSV